MLLYGQYEGGLYMHNIAKKLMEILANTGNGHLPIAQA